MSQRFNVYESDKLIAVVHAEHEEHAVIAACAKTDGHDPQRCSAYPILSKRTPPCRTSPPSRHVFPALTRRISAPPTQG